MNIKRNSNYHNKLQKNFARTQNLPQKVEREDDLDGRAPQHVEVGHEVHEALGVHRHQVHHLANGALFAGRGGDQECLAERPKNL